MLQLTTVRKEPTTPYSFEEKLFTWSLKPSHKISFVTIGCPHDGMEREDLLGLFPKRTQGPTDTDLYVWQIIRGIAWHLPIHAIRGMLPRFILDYNRYSSKELFREYAGKLFEDTEECCEDRQLIKYQEAYHDQIIKTVLTSKEFHGSSAIFLDLHGFAVHLHHGEFDIILGTSNTHTVKNGADKKIADFLKLKGYRVYIPEYKKYPITQDEREKYGGGFTTRNVFLKTGVDSVQVEISREIRTDKTLSKKLAEDIGEFLMTIS